jgi:hypothetical protein
MLRRVVVRPWCLIAKGHLTGRAPGCVCECVCVHVYPAVGSPWDLVPGRSLRRVVVPMLVGCLREMASLPMYVGSSCTISTVSVDVRPPGGWRCAQRSPTRAPSCSSQAFSSRRRAEHSTTREAHRNRMGAASAREQRRAGLCVCALPGAGCPSHLELDRRAACWAPCGVC